MIRLISTLDGPWLHLSEITAFEKHDLLHMFDTFGENDLSAIFDQKGQPQSVFQDHYTFYESSFNCKFWCADLWLGKELLKFTDVIPTPIETRHTANFIINKKQINRFLTLKFVEWFNVDCDYTWSGVDNRFDMSEILLEIDQIGIKNTLSPEIISFILSPTTIPPRWIDNPAQTINTSNVSSFGSTRWTWDNGLNDIVTGSAVSLITESVRFEKAIPFTEKTAYAMLGHTFPIWIGGYRQADEWDRLGFDVFPDVIDHSYQYHETLIERCWYAFANNQHLLCDLATVRNLRYRLRDRLYQNFQKITGNLVQKKNIEIIATWPHAIQQCITPVIASKFNNHLLA